MPKRVSTGYLSQNIVQAPAQHDCCEFWLFNYYSLIAILPLWCSLSAPPPSLISSWPTVLSCTPPRIISLSVIDPQCWCPPSKAEWDEDLCRWIIFALSSKLGWILYCKTLTLFNIGSTWGCGATDHWGGPGVHALGLMVRGTHGLVQEIHHPVKGVDEAEVREVNIRDLLR